MELHPKLIAAADMCEAGEDINLDEIAFLLRYAADEVTQMKPVSEERDKLLEKLRDRVKARCDLLGRGEKDLTRANEGTLEELEALDDELDREMKAKFPSGNISIVPVIRADEVTDLEIYQSGR